MSTISSTSLTRNGTGPLAISAEPATLAELVSHEAMTYRAWNTTDGEFIASQLERLAQLIRFTGAKTPQEHLDRMAILDGDARE